MRHFLGLRGSAAFNISSTDNTPNAISFPNVQSGLGSYTSVGQQITGISSSITLKLYFDSVFDDGGGSTNNLASLAYGVNSTNTAPATFTTVATGTPIAIGTYSSTFTVNNNQWLFLRIARTGSNSCGNLVISVINQSDSNTVLTSPKYKLSGKVTCP